MHYTIQNFKISLGLAVFIVFLGFEAVFAQNRPLAPETASKTVQKQAVIGSKMMVATAHPEASKAAYDILIKGGTAAEAGIAAQLVLGLVEPQSSGLGGGAFAVYYDAQTQLLRTFDARETAPDSAGRYLFLKDDGKPMGFFEAAIGGRAIGVPGVPKLLELLHDQYGRLNWSLLFPYAIDLAERGFTVTERMYKMLLDERPRFQIDTKTFLHFYPDTMTPVQAGTVMNNPEYAITLKNFRDNKTNDFYNGKIAEEIVEKARMYNGLLATEDLAEYEVKERKAVCSDYRGYQVCSMGQPSSGGLTMLIALGILENFDLRALGKDNPKSYHLISEASRLAFEDRNQYMADPDFEPTPDTLLLNKIYLKTRSAYINSDEAMLSTTYGVPLGWNDQKRMKDGTVKDSGTSHITIVDQYGNILSMTTSIEYAFGSHVMSNGFLLNNQLTDFSFNPSDGEGNLAANRVEGKKRPRSSMAPTIIFDSEGEPFLAIGSAGGSRIIGYVLQRIVAAIDWDMNIQEAIDAPHILHRGKKLEVEMLGVDYAKPLKDLGHPVLVGEMNSGLTAIQFKEGEIIGAVDSRRDGVAIGQ
ncbi:MAG: gamma-glutamyltransferase [Pseudomonadota bacterium]